MSQKKDVLLLGRDRKETAIRTPVQQDHLTVFNLSVAPDQHWVALFLKTWETRLPELPAEFATIRPKFDERKLTVDHSPGLDGGRLERHLRTIIAITNKISLIR